MSSRPARGTSCGQVWPKAATCSLLHQSSLPKCRIKERQHGLQESDLILLRHPLAGLCVRESQTGKARLSLACFPARLARPPKRANNFSSPKLVQYCTMATTIAQRQRPASSRQSTSLDPTGFQQGRRVSPFAICIIISSKGTKSATRSQLMLAPRRINIHKLMGRPFSGAKWNHQRASRVSRPLLAASLAKVRPLYHSNGPFV